MLACLLIAGWVAVALGLMISAFATTENQATSLIPLTLIPQLLLGGAMVTVASMSAPDAGRGVARVHALVLCRDWVRVRPQRANR